MLRIDQSHIKLFCDYETMACLFCVTKRAFEQVVALLDAFEGRFPVFRLALGLAVVVIASGKFQGGMRIACTKLSPV